jgi:malate dehydrogenase (oxaloacetate-decarboxylating)(NADP+)
MCTKDGAIGNTAGEGDSPHWHDEAGSGRGTIDDGHALWANQEIADGTSLLDTCKQFKPNILLGLSTVGGLFDEELVKTMGSFNERPVIMPMSNPTAKAECTPEQAYKWTEGRAVVATGSPFEPVTMADGSVKIPSQCNNMYIFPGIGLAASVSGTRKITDEMLYRAAEACTEAMTAEEVCATLP